MSTKIANAKLWVSIYFFFPFNVSLARFFLIYVFDLMFFVFFLHWICGHLIVSLQFHFTSKHMIIRKNEGVNVIPEYYTIEACLEWEVFFIKSLYRT